MIYKNNGNAATVRIGTEWHTVPHGGTVDAGEHAVNLGGDWETVDVAADDLAGLTLDELRHVVDLEQVDAGSASTVAGVTRKIRDARTRAAKKENTK